MYNREHLGILSVKAAGSPSTVGGHVTGVSGTGIELGKVVGVDSHIGFPHENNDTLVKQ